MPPHHRSVGQASSPKSILLRFGLGQASRSLIWCVTDLLIGYHLTARIALSGQIAGAILFGSFLLGAVLNVVVATWLARSEKTGKSVLSLQAGFGIASVAAALLLLPEPAAQRLLGSSDGLGWLALHPPLAFK